MPTYTLSYSNIKLNSEKKSNIAKAITKTHKKTTAANTYFAQVIFNKIEKKVILWESFKLLNLKYFYMAK